MHARNYVGDANRCKEVKVSMKARLPNLTSNTHSPDGDLNMLISALKAVKTIEPFRVMCTPKELPYFADYTVSSVSAYFSKLVNLNDNEDTNMMIQGICLAIHTYIMVLVELEQSSNPQKFAKDLSTELKRVCELSTKLTIAKYETPYIHAPLLTYSRCTCLHALLVQIWSVFPWSIDIDRIFYYLLCMGVLPKEFCGYCISIVDSYLEGSDILGYLEDKEYYSVIQLYKGLTPRKYRVGANPYIMTTMPEQFSYINEELVYDRFSKPMNALSKSEQLSFFYPNVKQWGSRKISEYHNALVKALEDTTYILCSYISEISVSIHCAQTELRCERVKEEAKQKVKDAERTVKNSNRIKKSSSNKAEVVYVDRVIKDTEEVDMLKSKNEKYLSRIASLESTIRTMEREQRDATKLQHENVMLTEYIDSLNAEDVEDSTDELTAEDTQKLSALKAHLVLPDTHSLKALRSILPNAIISYIPRDSMFSQKVPMNCDVYLFCTGMSAHKSYYNWRSQVEDKNYVLCATVGIKAICKKLLGATLQED